jgi:hypothetical protein
VRRRAAQRFFLRLLGLFLAPTHLRRTTGTRRTTFGRRWSQVLFQQGGQFLHTITAVAPLAAGTFRVQDQNAVLVEAPTQSGQQPLALVLGQGSALAHVKTQFDPGIGFVDMLSTRPRTAIKRQTQFGGGDAQFGIDQERFHNVDAGPRPTSPAPSRLRGANAAARPAHAGGQRQPLRRYRSPNRGYRAWSGSRPRCASRGESHR